MQSIYKGIPDAYEEVIFALYKTHFYEMIKEPDCNKGIKLAFNNENSELNVEIERFENVLLKCAFGHLKFENSETEFNKPDHIWFKPMHTLTEEEERIFFSVSEMEKAPEIGSRAMQRLYLNEQGKPMESWIPVQDGVYSYFISISKGLKIVRMIIRNYLTCEIAWTDNE
jgi:hypothetical protein